MLLSYNMNSKLKNGNIASFGLPPGITCGRLCKGCYASKGRYKFKNVIFKREYNLEQSRRPEFVANMVNEIIFLNKKFGVKYIRIHDSGDFYSNEYIDKIYQIFKSLPHITGYAYTKRLIEFPESFKKLRSLRNFILINSLIDNKPNFGPKNYILKLANEKKIPICPNYYNKNITCNSPCKICLNKNTEKTGVLFIQH